MAEVTTKEESEVVLRTLCNIQEKKCVRSEYIFVVLLSRANDELMQKKMDRHTQAVKGKVYGAYAIDTRVRSAHLRLLGS